MSDNLNILFSSPFDTIGSMLETFFNSTFGVSQKKQFFFLLNIHIQERTAVARGTNL
jgi:hypothetical protein